MAMNKLRSWWIMDDFELATQQKQIVAIKMRTAPSLDNKSTGQGDQFATIWTMKLLIESLVIMGWGLEILVPI